jgi:hypothetical protein
MNKPTTPQPPKGSAPSTRRPLTRKARIPIPDIDEALHEVAMRQKAAKKRRTRG